MHRSGLQYESAEDAVAVLAKYDRASDSWGFPQSGNFWEAVKEAHRRGCRGKGQRIAIIDSGFDMSIPKLQAQTRTVVQGAPTPSVGAHGTVVALLAGTVAPEAQLDLYSISSGGAPDLSLITKALRRIRKSDVTVVNLSLGDDTRRGGVETTREHREQCPLCREAALTAADGRLVMASSGNKAGNTFCPARDEAVLGVGFQREQRQIVKTDDGGQLETAVADSPSFEQALPEFTLMQPKGVLGSSFASPLIAGIASLIGDTKNVPGLVKVCSLSAEAALFHALSQGAAAEVVTALRNAAGARYSEALKALPHIHHGTADEPWCIECSIFVQDLYTNAGLFAVENGQLDDGYWLLRAAIFLAPWSDNAMAGMARLIEQRGEDALKKGDASSSLRFYQAAREGYTQALKIRPGFEPYVLELNKITDRLGGFWIITDKPPGLAQG